MFELGYKIESTHYLPYPSDVVFGAVPIVCKKMGWKVVEVNMLSGWIKANTKISALSVGEAVFIKISRIDEKNTSVCVSSKSRYGVSSIMSAIKNRLNAFNLIEELKKYLLNTKSSLS